MRKKESIVLKRLSSALIIALFTAATAFAAPIPGKVVAIDGKKVQITMTGEAGGWVKKGAPVKIKGGTGRITDLDGTTVTISTSRASQLKVGDEVSFDKGRAGSGC